MDDGYDDMMNWLNSHEPVRKDEPGRRYPTIVLVMGDPSVINPEQPIDPGGVWPLDPTTQSIEIPGIGTVHLN